MKQGEYPFLFKAQRTYGVLSLRIRPQDLAKGVEVSKASISLDGGNLPRI